MIGSGKTTIGKRLASTLQLDFHDLDREMNRILGHSFHKLVLEKGWVAFRELEYSICKNFAQMQNAVIALGGGTVRYEWNMDVLNGTGLIILLTASNEELLFRGLFFGQVEPILGRFATNVVTSIPFVLMHSFTDYSVDTVIFLSLQLLPLSLAWGWLMQKSDSIWGSILFHAAMDLPIIVGLFSTL